MEVAADDRRLRILLTVHHDVTRTAGASGATLALADELTLRGHTVDLIGLGLLQRSHGNTLDAIRFPHVLGRLLRRRLLDGDYDVVDASSGDLAYVGAGRVRASSTAVFTRSHGLEHLAVARRRRAASDGELSLRWRYHVYHGGLRLREVARSIRAADGVLLLNDAEEDFATATLGVPRERVWRTAPVRRPLPQLPRTEQRDVLVLGARAWRKGSDLAIRVLDTLLRGQSELTASWHGLDDPASTSAEFGADVRPRVEVGGGYDAERLAELLAGHRVLLFPSRSEGFGLVVLEALASGLPVVAADVPGPRGLLADGAGLLVPDGHVEGFAAALRRVLADDALRAACAKKGREVAERFEPGRVVDELLVAYRTVLAVKRPAST